MPRILTTADIADFRSRLCDVAAQLFLEMGHDGFNMRELAKRLGVSAMTPYRYFKDKDAILCEVRARAFARFADWLEGALIATDGTTLSSAYAQFAIQEQTQYRLMFDLSQTQATSAPEFALQERRARAAIIDHVARLLERGGLSGNPESLGLLLWAVLHGVAALYLTGKISGEDLHLVLSETAGRFACGPASQISMRTSLPASEIDRVEPWWSTPASFQASAVAGE